MKNYTKEKEIRSGQVMLISVIMLGGVLLSAAAIGGLLTIYQIRASNDIVSSAKAVFAADSGIEITTWCLYKGCDDPLTPEVENAENPPEIFFNDSSVSVEASAEQSPGALEVVIFSRGFAADGKVLRTLETIFVTE